MSLRPTAVAGFAFLVFANVAFAQQMTVNAAGQPQSINFSLAKVFIFLFLTLGPLKVLGPFVQMTRNCDTTTRRNLAFRATMVSIVAIILAAVTGASILEKWGISIGSLLLTAGLILFLVALKPVLEQFAPPQSRVAAAPAPDMPPPSPMQIAFPTIVTPYGIAILIVLVTLPADIVTDIKVISVAVIILLLDLLAMLFAQRILTTPLVPIALGIVEPIMGVLQVALGVSAVVVALRMLGFKT